MAFELYGMLAGNVSPMTGENIKPAYGGEYEAFLRKVVTPIYNVIAEVFSHLFLVLYFLFVAVTSR
jgi:callose synthase